MPLVLHSVVKYSTAFYKSVGAPWLLLTWNDGVIHLGINVVEVAVVAVAVVAVVEIEIATVQQH